MSQLKIICPATGNLYHAEFQLLALLIEQPSQAQLELDVAEGVVVDVQAGELWRDIQLQWVELESGGCWELCMTSDGVNANDD